ncbi:hypothetical protein E2C01_002487 [Portunus trituberculatus]|uniref:Uncharacterized protein n=1 Tax=Portunus trituberculatus TaxID=210409 RepID=A0A5B7CK21_PORTR|nr:hypothetical protein [Portunus trituberculatus]
MPYKWDRFSDLHLIFVIAPLICFVHEIRIRKTRNNRGGMVKGNRNIKQKSPTQLSVSLQNRQT